MVSRSGAHKRSPHCTTVFKHIFKHILGILAKNDWSAPCENLIVLHHNNTYCALTRSTAPVRHCTVTRGTSSHKRHCTLTRGTAPLRHCTLTRGTSSHKRYCTLTGGISHRKRHCALTRGTFTSHLELLADRQLQEQIQSPAGPVVHAYMHDDIYSHTCMHFISSCRGFVASDRF